MTILIFANGKMPASPAWLTPYFIKARLVIAADGGLRHILAAGRWPDLIIGDMDSLPMDWELDAGKMPASEVTIELQHYSRDKDETDLELALLAAAERAENGTEEILVFGALGGRLDQMLANLLLFSHPNLENYHLILIEPQQRAWIIRERGEIKGQIGDTISLLPWGGAVHIKQTAGLKWALQDEWLTVGPARGVSNELIEPVAIVEIEAGVLLCVLIRVVPEQLTTQER